MKFIGLASAVLSVVNTSLESSWLDSHMLIFSEPVRLGLWGVALIALSVLIRRKAVAADSTPQASSEARPLGDLAESLPRPA